MNILKIKKGNEWVGIPAIVGPQGEQGPKGEGVPTGGAAGDMLVKASSSNYHAMWITPPYVPDALVAVETTPSQNGTINWLYE